MNNIYKKFLDGKGTNNFWKKAKQHEYHIVDEVVLGLQNINELTTRNSMSLRLMGFVENFGNDNLKLTSSGKIFLNSGNKKQDILDEQLLKIYLDSEINDRLNIPIFPLAVMYNIFTVFNFITFEEYKIFVCWVNNNNEIPVVMELIKKYRKVNPADKIAVNQIFNNKISELNIQNFDDNIYRLFIMFTLSSYLRVEGNRYEEIIYRNSKISTYKSLISSVKKIKVNNYLNELYNFKKIITQKADHEDILDPIYDLSNEDRNILLKQINEKNSLPDISVVNPIYINPKIIEKDQLVHSTRAKTYKKIDYLKRDTRNRLVGLYAEKVVFKAEYNRLVKIGENDLAQKVIHESLFNDALGYDITSYEVLNEKNLKSKVKHIEVKAVRGLPSTFTFFISKNELERVKNDPSHRIYIVFNYDTGNPQIWELPHLFSVEKFIKIDPVKFQVTLTIKR